MNTEHAADAGICFMLRNITLLAEHNNIEGTVYYYEAAVLTFWKWYLSEKNKAVHWTEMEVLPTSSCLCSQAWALSWNSWNFEICPEMSWNWS